VNVDPNGEMLPVDAVSFDIEIEDSTTPGTVVYTETINLNITDLKQNVIVTSIVEDKVGKIDIAFSDVIEAGKVRVPSDKHSDEMKAFIKDNSGGTFTLAGENADKFRIDAQTGEVVSKSYIHFNSQDAELNTYGIDIIYTAGQNSFTDQASLTFINSTADDNPTQASGRPLVGVDAIEASSLVSEEEDLTIYGNVGTAEIDVNGKASAYELVQAINSRQGETGVYANANTRVNISFPDQFEALDDAISFMLQGMNDEPILVSGNVEFGIVGGRDANVRGLADAINSVSGKTGISAKVSPNGSTLHMMSNEGHDILVENFTMSVQNIPMNISATDDELNSIGDVQQLFKGVGNDDTFRSTGQITFHSPYVFSIETNLTGINGGGLFQLTPGAAKLVSVSELDVLTVDNAKKMLTAVDAALVRIDLERSDLGATMSRMEHTIRNLSNIVVNTKAARSRIQDANIAEETTEMTKAQVLSQAAQAMLAQANRTSQSILSLLQG
ncbi:MAG: flagellin, partial [Burkholderiaceae bacterium]